MRYVQGPYKSETDEVFLTESDLEKLRAGEEIILPVEDLKRGFRRVVILMNIKVRYEKDHPVE